MNSFDILAKSPANAPLRTSAPRTTRAYDLGTELVEDMMESRRRFERRQAISESERNSYGRIDKDAGKTEGVEEQDGMRLK